MTDTSDTSGTGSGPSAARAALFRVQELETTVQQLDHRLTNLPEQAELDRARSAAQANQAGVDDAEARRYELSRSQKRKEEDLAAVEARIGDQEAKVYGGGVTGPRELQALQDEIAGLRERASTVEDQVLEALEELEPIDAELASLAAGREAIDAELARAEAAVEAAAGAIYEGRAAAEAESETAAGVAEPTELDTYRKRRASFGASTVVKLVGTNCEGCPVHLSAVEADRIRQEPAGSLATCEDCGRLVSH
ncbi:MAG: hypothetical protein GY745_11695 [Actinomycetia bacterium]|nr:hypothetical protein [Actinomycetes bacterium]MCP4085703.1 hypothetical protein [Actinomycetes bacterium]